MSRKMITCADCGMVLGELGPYMIETDGPNIFGVAKIICMICADEIMDELRGSASKANMEVNE